MKNTKATKAMKAAWTNARKWAAKLGGKPSLYFIYCLRDAWEWVKSGKAQTVKLFNIGRVVRETEKAVMVTVEVESFWGLKTADVWFPKSKLVDGRAPLWLIKAKEDELKEKFKGGFYFVNEWTFA